MKKIIQKLIGNQWVTQGSQILILILFCSILHAQRDNKYPLKGNNHLVSGVESYRLIVKFNPDYLKDVNHGKLIFSDSQLKSLPSGGAELEFLEGFEYRQVVNFNDSDKEKMRNGTELKAPPQKFNFYKYRGLVFVEGAEALSPEEVYNLSVKFETYDFVEYAALERVDPEPPPSSGATNNDFVLAMSSHDKECSISANIPLMTPDFSDLQHYKYDVYSDVPDVRGINAEYAWSIGIFGQGIQIADIEWGMNYNHEDLMDSDFIELVATTDNSFDNHGTAVCGVLFARDNGLGMIGMVHGADKLYGISEIPAGRVSGIMNGLAELNAGDVFLYEMQTSGMNGEFVPADFNQAVWDITSDATTAGIIIVAAAGNGNQNLDGAFYDDYRARGDNGTIMVGAGTKAGRNKADFSTFGSPVHVQGWGDFTVATCGYGDLYNDGPNADYTNDFAGTSSATPIVASAAVAVQSWYKIQTGGSVLSPIQMRNLLISTGTPQGSGGHIGPLPNIQSAIESLKCDLDIDDVPPIVNCPANLSVGNDLGDCGAIVNYPVATASDNCGIFSITYTQNSGTFFPVGTTIITVTVTDINDNVNNCNFNVTVNDAEAPSINCFVTEIERSNDPGVCTYTVQGAEFNPAGSDNCPGFFFVNDFNNSATLNGAVFPVGSTDVTWTIEDAASNTATCTNTIIVRDNEPPIIMCSNGSVVFNGEDEHILDPDDYTVYSDNCGIASVVLDPPVITCDELGEILQVTATVTDIYDNTANCSFNLEVLGLPCGWSFTPDGINCTDGNDVSYSVPLDEFYVESTNCFFSNPFNSDVMGFAQYELCGDGTVTAHVSDISGNALGWAGVSMRENNDGGSKKVQLLTNRSNLSRREIRFTTNSNSFPQQFVSFNRYWLRLTRSGNQFSGHVSADGANWHLVMAANVIMPACIELGLVVTNYNNNSIVTGTFSNVTVDEVMPKPAIVSNNVLFEEENETSISVFPNPTASGEIFIDLSGYQHQQMSIITLDPLGRVVGSKQIDEVEHQLEILSLRTFTPGIYYLKFISGNGATQIQKVVYSGG